MIAIIDYGVGNLFSLRSSFSAVGADVTVSSDPEVIKAADGVVLPGVGAFRDAAAALARSGMAGLVKDLAAEGKPLIGICLGMQLLFERSFEYGEYEGLGLIPGDVVPLAGYVPAELKIPQIGWNALQLRADCPLFRYINEGDCVYFVHSYYAQCAPQFVAAETEYGAPVTAVVQRGNVYGCQFHPEKSGTVGLNMLKAFCEIAERGAAGGTGVEGC